jgi:hypothetical protein
MLVVFIGCNFLLKWLLCKIMLSADRKSESDGLIVSEFEVDAVYCTMALDQERNIRQNTA